MSTADSEWPAFFPDGVPPETATAASGVAYRLVRQLPPDKSDFRSSHEENPKRDFGEDFWMACGVSFHKRLADARRTRARFKPLRKRMIARGTLRSEFGVMLRTGSGSHLTVWLRKGVTPHESFTENAEGKK